MYRQQFAPRHGTAAPAALTGVSSVGECWTPRRPAPLWQPGQPSGVALAPAPCMPLRDGSDVASSLQKEDIQQAVLEGLERYNAQAKAGAQHSVRALQNLGAASIRCAKGAGCLSSPSIKTPVHGTKIMHWFRYLCLRTSSITLWSEPCADPAPDVDIFAESHPVPAGIVRRHLMLRNDLNSHAV